MKQVAIGAAITLILGSLVTGAAASGGPIEYRQAVFQAIGGHMTALVGIVRREVPHGDDIRVHANGIADLAPLIGHIFPEGSGDGRTDALPAIWNDPDGFARRREAFLEAAEDLRSAADRPMGEFVAAFQTLGGSCQGCHDDYRRD